jgi:hypothetical protein
VPNGNNDQPSSNQLQASYTDMSHCDTLFDFLEQNCCLKELYYRTAIYMCNAMQEELREEYMGLYAAGQMMNDRLCGQLSYNYSLSNASQLKLEYNLKQILVEKKGSNWEGYCGTSN